MSFREITSSLGIEPEFAKKMKENSPHINDPYLFTHINIKDDIIRKLRDTSDPICVSMSCLPNAADYLIYLTGSNIHYLDLSHSETCPNLRYLSCCNINRLAIELPIKNIDLKYLSHVKELYLYNCYNITDEGLVYLANVPHINFWHCDKITDYGLACLTGSISIGIYGCNKITSGGLKYINSSTKLINWYSSSLNNYLINISTNILVLEEDVYTHKELKYLANVKNVCFRFCIQIEKGALRYLIRTENLFFIDSDIELSVIDIQVMPNIKTIHFYHMQSVSSKFKENCARVGIIVYEYSLF